MMSLELIGMEMGTAVLLVGLLGVTLAGLIALRNWAAGILWSFSLIILIFAGVFNIPLEFFWLGLIVTGVFLIVGFVVRWST